MAILFFSSACRPNTQAELLLSPMRKGATSFLRVLTSAKSVVYDELAFPHRHMAHISSPSRNAVVRSQFLSSPSSTQISRSGSRRFVMLLLQHVRTDLLLTIGFSLASGGHRGRFRPGSRACLHCVAAHSPRPRVLLTSAPLLPMNLTRKYLVTSILSISIPTSPTTHLFLERSLTACGRVQPRGNTLRPL